MEFNALEQLISETASEKGIEKAVIVDDLADILKIKYGISIMEKERNLIDEVKTKIITKLYNSDSHIAQSTDDYAKLFKLDSLENDYINSALEEMQQEGLATLSKTQLSLTKAGVMKFKEFYGEI